MRYGQENKSAASIEFRLTPEEKKQIQNYCKEKHYTVSEFMRMVCFNFINKQEEK